jgi:UDP-N-acetylglucosamine 4,6-dehydratase|tara:strand:+ start:86 stop:1072 length:987 start_codon:yes stop_codon:yes gene_type:complete
MFNNKNIMITGGTGSFGVEFVSLLLKKFRCNKIIIFSRDELKQHDMRIRFNDAKNLRFLIGDIRDYDRLKFSLKEVDYVVHAAALKHVPIAEYNPLEFVKTNIIGSSNLVNAALENKVKKVIALSTDKAVNPINLYGATKLSSEKIFLDANAIGGKNATKFSVVRYGNVLNSRGSLIPLILKFKSEKKKQFPLTDERMTRFFIKLSDAAQFVINSFRIMDKGEIFIPKMKSLFIKDLIKCIYPSSNIKIIGVRPGEKIDEVLISDYEKFDTYELKNSNSYVVIPKRNYYKSNMKNLRKLSGFEEYNSRNNGEFLNKKMISKLIMSECY